MTALETLLAALPPAHAAALADAWRDREFHVEACWHSHDPTAEAVVGIVDGEPGRLVALARAVCPAHADAIARWLEATPGILDIGCKLGHHGAQVYARGDFAAAAAIAGLAAAGAQTQPVAIDNLLHLLERPTLSMVGLELGDDRVEGAVYASVARAPETTAAVRDAFGFLVRVVAPDQLEVWDACASALLDSPRDEIVYVSMSAGLAWPWAKLDVGPRPLALADRLAPCFGSGPIAGAAAAARRYNGTAWSHVGARFGSGFGPVFYLPVHGDRD